MQFRVLGPVELGGPDGTGIDITAEKQRRLLAALLLRANSWASTAFLVEAVWPDGPPTYAVNNLKTYIYHLRRTIPPAARGGPRIGSRAGGYRLLVERDECDATVFEDRVAAATEALARAEPATAVEQLEVALGLWCGEPYEPLATVEVRAESERLRARRWHARDTLAEALLAAGRAGDAVTLLRPLTAEDPLREKTWEHLLHALHHDGRRADVLVAFQQVRRVLVDELGVEPGPELRRLHQLALCAGEPEPDTPDVQSGPAARVDAAEAIPAGQVAGRVVKVVTHRPVRLAWRPMARPPRSVRPAPVRLLGDGPRRRRRAARWGAAVVLSLVAGLVFGAMVLGDRTAPGGRSDPAAGPRQPAAGQAGAGISQAPGSVVPSVALPVPQAEVGSVGDSAAPRSGQPRSAPMAAAPKGTAATQAPPPAASNNGTPVLTFLSPSPGQVVRGVVTIRVKVSNPSRLQQVDFHQLTVHCHTGGYKRFIGPDTTPDANGVYEITFDTRQAADGCLVFGAVGLDRNNNRVLYPREGTYLRVTVDN